MKITRISFIPIAGTIIFLVACSTPRQSRAPTPDSPPDARLDTFAIPLPTAWSSPNATRSATPTLTTPSPKLALSEAPAFSAQTSTALPTLPVTPGSGQGLRFHDGPCGFRVDIPPQWEVVSQPVEQWGWFDDPAIAGCVFGFRPANWEQIVAEQPIMLGDSAITLATARTPPDAVSQWAFLQLRGGEWIVTGRQGAEEPADVSELSGLLLVRGQGEEGTYTKDTASYSGLALPWRALLSDRSSRTALFLQGPLPYDNELQILLETFHFE